jgi:pyruvate/2-oxoglutarate dehydrogenase complex dihydrolipoamide acyltransferase (E2) component
MRDGLAYISIMQGGQKTLVNVDVLGIQDGVAVIRAKDSASLAEGQEIFIP